MTKLWQIALAVVGTILIPLAISSMSVATNYGGMREALQVVQEQGKSVVEQNTMIMQEITAIKLTGATQAQQLISLEGSNSLMVMKQDEMLKQYGRLEANLTALQVSSDVGDSNLMVSYDDLKKSQRELGVKLDLSNERYSEVMSDLARVEMHIRHDEGEDKFTGADGRHLIDRVDRLDAKVDKLSARSGNQ
ncbi:TMhelix containing protein [Vibrio phage 1.081.O._10N.286.52.C2]|nr:TMhelix containing protein [Vibrio phage 1.081.O._10N.286.52.C2]